MLFSSGNFAILSGMESEPPLQFAFLWLLNLLYPKNCVSCGRTLSCRNRDFLCPDCRRFLMITRPPLCEACGLPLAGEVVPPAVCFGCRRRPPAFRRARSAFILEDVGQKFVLRFKYGQCPFLAPPAVRLLKEAGDRFYSWPDYGELLPVPLHPRKRRERGFNQSELLARGLSRETGIPLAKRKLVRIRYTQTQTRLSPKERAENVSGAFAVTDPEYFRGKKLLLIDDVFTTGATVSECARVLKKAASAAVDVLTLARAC